MSIDHVFGDAEIRLYTLEEVSEQTGFNLLALQRDCRAGRVAHVHRGRERRMTREQVQALIDAHVIAAAQPEDPRAAMRARFEQAKRRRAAQGTS